MYIMFAFIHNVKLSLINETKDHIIQFYESVFGKTTRINILKTFSEFQTKLDKYFESFEV